MEPGYEKTLCILAFDQRASLLREVFGVGSDGLTPEMADQIERIKLGIYEGFRYALEKGVPADSAAILVDEQFGHAVLSDAKFHGYTFALTTEKAGADEFDFEYGDDFTSHLLKYRPTFAKALVRRNPEVANGLSVAEHARLMSLREFCDREKIKLLIELIIPPTESDLAKVEGNLSRFDSEIRPKLEKDLIAIFQKEKIEADVWKVEGFAEPEHYRELVDQVQKGGRKNVGIVVLGRNASPELVEKWLQAGGEVPGVIGFAIGRTIFLEPVKSYVLGELSWEELVERVAERYAHFFQIFTAAQK